MAISAFISVGENIHCTRIYKVGGAFCSELPGGGFGIHYQAGREDRVLPVPPVFMEGADWQAGRVKHCAVAIWQGVYGNPDGQAAGVDYLRNMARRQEEAGASYLDINVDEFSTDITERIRLMQWTVRTVQETVRLPVSIDSSNLDILQAGLEACDFERGRPMVNSVSLERTAAIDAAAAFKAVVIASAAGEKDMPESSADRVANVATLMPKLKACGFEDADIHIDPLVFPISVDGRNGLKFLDAITTIRQTYGPRIHLVAGLSNVSFGMPNRKLINQVFAHLAVAAGADGGIVNPLEINAKTLKDMDPSSEPYRLARALLLGEDDFGMNFITACRENRI